jgi:ABC-type Fe3+ transport system substrate-binding protein
VKFDAPERKSFEARFKDKDGFWTDVYPTVHSIPYNTKLVAQKDLPRRYTDLLDPKWKGKLGANRNNYMVIAAMIDLYGTEKGEDFIRKLAQQEPQVRSGGTLTATLVGAGEMPLAFMVYANNVENVKESGSPVDWVRVEEPLYAESHPIAIMAKAPHPNAARLLAEFAISKEGQQLISNLGKMPGRSDVQPKIGVDREKLRMIPPEHEAKTAHYQKWFVAKAVNGRARPTFSTIAMHRSAVTLASLASTKPKVSTTLDPDRHWLTFARKTLTQIASDDSGYVRCNGKGTAIGSHHFS